MILLYNDRQERHITALLRHIKATLFHLRSIAIEVKKLCSDMVKAMLRDKWTYLMELAAKLLSLWK